VCVWMPFLSLFIGLAGYNVLVEKASRRDANDNFLSKIPRFDLEVIKKSNNILPPAVWLPRRIGQQRGARSCQLLTYETFSKKPRARDRYFCWARDLDFYLDFNGWRGWLGDEWPVTP